MRSPSPPPGDAKAAPQPLPTERKASPAPGDSYSGQDGRALWPRLLVGLALLLSGAHFLRQGTMGLALALLVPLALLFSRRRWVALVMPPLLVVASLAWLHTASELARIRAGFGLPYGRLLAILIAVAALTLVAAGAFFRPALRRRFNAAEPSAATSAAAFLLAAALLALVQLKVSRPLLLPDRFWPGSGAVLILLAASYAAWIAEKLLLEPVARWRKRLWLFFSLVFFSQLALGLLVDQRFLMRPDVLHFPIPALVVAGPLYRGGHVFMLWLFLSTLLIVGPAWCSHICYFGAWDLQAAAGRKRPLALGKHAPLLRVALLLAVVLVAIALRQLGSSPLLAGSLALAFGLAGLALMLLWSRRRGTMAHCIVYCPIGLLANLGGKLSPFRLRIGGGCTNCGACTIVCRYDALRPEHLARRRVGLSCSLCGDCLRSCRTHHLQLGFPGLSATNARRVFVALVVALHAASLCLARI